MVCDDVTNILTIIGPRIIEQYTINGKKLHVYHFHDINKNSGQINELKTVAIMPFNFNFDGRLIVCGDKIGNLNFFVVDETSYELKFIHSKKVHIFPIISIFVLQNRNKIITNDTNGNKFITKLVIKEATQEQQQSSIQLSSTSFSPENSSTSFVPSTSSSSVQNLSIEKDQSHEDDLVDLKTIVTNDSQKQSLIDEACYCAYCENVATVKCMNCRIPLCSNCVVDVKIKNGNIMKLCQNCASEVQGNGNQNDANDADVGNNSQNTPFSRRLSSFF